MSTNVQFSLTNGTADTLSSYTLIGTNSGVDIDVLTGADLAAQTNVSNSGYNIDSGKTTTFAVVFTNQYGTYQTNGCVYDISSSSSVRWVSCWLLGSKGDYQFKIAYVKGTNPPAWSELFDVYAVPPSSSGMAGL